MPDHNPAVEWAKEGLPGGLQSSKQEAKVQVSFAIEN